MTTVCTRLRCSESVFHLSLHYFLLLYFSLLTRSGNFPFRRYSVMVRSMAPFPVLFLLFLGVPLAEIYFLIVVGGWIGALPTVLLVILTSAVGAALARHQGYATLQSLQSDPRARRDPGR